MMKPTIHFLIAGLFVCAQLIAKAADISELSLEELLQVQVTSVSRKAQNLQDVAGAVYVITHDDIERSGATSIPEALRMAPGVNVAHLSNNRWAVSVRGFNRRFSNKLLVLIDGRAIYSPLFSGVIWEAEDTLLEDVERIEVIRGPGAAIWGSNAVNGVINIITRNTHDTQGNQLIAGAGTEERGFASFRHGGKSEDGYYRIWGQAYSKDDSVDLAGQQSNDAARSGRIGFRGDWTLNNGNHLMMSGDAYNNPSGDRWNTPDVTSPTGIRVEDIRQTNNGANFLVRNQWLHADGSDSELSAYVNYSITGLENTIREQRTTVDLDYHTRDHIGGRHDVVWGAGYRISHDNTSTQGIFDMQPVSDSFRLASAFVQDEITLPIETVHLILGARLEHNNYTGFEFQPNVRATWTPNPNQVVWGAISRAVRTPSRSERDGALDLRVTPPNMFVHLPMLLRNEKNNDRTLSSETDIAYELGYRHQLSTILSVDIAAFFNNYDKLRSAELGIPALRFVPPSPFPSYIVQPVLSDNSVKAQSYGLELAVDYHPLSWWRLQPSYSYLHMHSSAKTNDPVDELNALLFVGRAPKHQFSLLSSMTLPHQQQLDLWLKHISALEFTDQSGTRIPSYTEVDLRYAWKPVPSLELSLVGQNLFDRRHPEFTPDLLPSQTTQVERGMYVKINWQF